MRSCIVVLACLGGCGQPSVTLPSAAGDDYGPPLHVHSDAFADGGTIPTRYTCNGEGVSPPLSWTGAPQETASFALVVDDPDARHKVWVHWVAWGIDPTTGALDEDVAPDDPAFVQGTNDAGKLGWSPPCPPKIGGAHRYVVHIFAADLVPDLPTSTTRDDLYTALDGHILSFGELTGHFDR